MIRSLYSVRDESSTLFMAVQVNENDAVAIRNFDFALKNNEMMHFRPSDFSLWLLGTYDDQTGVISSCDPVLIKRGVKNGK